MSELTKQVREDAAAELNKMANALYEHASDMVKTTEVTTSHLLKLALGGRTESIFKKAVSALAAKREAELLALYQKADIVPTVTDIGKASGKTGGQE